MQYTVWSPHQANEINSLERVQRRAIRFITGNRRRTSVTALRANIDLPTLEQRTVAKLGMLYKISNQEVAINVPSHYMPIIIPTMQIRHRHSQHYSVISTRTDSYLHNFFLSTISARNQLPTAAGCSHGTINPYFQ